MPKSVKFSLLAKYEQHLFLCFNNNHWLYLTSDSSSAKVKKSNGHLKGLHHGAYGNCRDNIAIKGPSGQQTDIKALFVNFQPTSDKITLALSLGVQIFYNPLADAEEALTKLEEHRRFVDAQALIFGLRKTELDDTAWNAMPDKISHFLSRHLEGLQNQGRPDEEWEDVVLPGYSKPPWQFFWLTAESSYEWSLVSPDDRKALKRRRVKR